MEVENEDLKEVNGVLYTHWECTHCGEENEIEGDVKGEEVECNGCGRIFTLVENL